MIKHIDFKEVKKVIDGIHEHGKYRPANNCNGFIINNIYFVLGESCGFDWYVGNGKTLKEAILNMKFYKINQYSGEPINKLLLALSADGRE